MNVQAIWAEALPEVRKQVTGVGTWAAVNGCVPIALEDDTFVVGLSHSEMELAGHLRMPHTKRVIETIVSQKAGRVVSLRVIDGTTDQDWEAAKRRDAESVRLQRMAMDKAKQEVAARSTWEGTYEQLNRAYSAIPNKSMPQNRARFYKEAIKIVSEARKAHGGNDDLSERNFARCIERVAQYSDVPSSLVALDVLRAVGEA
ncbi:MAG: hypothetical protein ACK4XJ_07345 [Fimbriimonadaceae bacterium]